MIKDWNTEPPITLHGASGDFMLYSQDSSIVIVNVRLNMKLYLPKYAAKDLWPLMKLFSEEQEQTTPRESA